MLKSLYRKQAASFDRIRVNVVAEWLGRDDEQGRIVTFTARQPGEGVTTIVSGLAESMAKISPGSLLVLDAGSGRNRIAARLGADGPELTVDDLLSNDRDPSEFIGTGSGIEVLKLGKIPPSRQYAFARALFDRIRSRYQAIFVDGGALSAGGTQWLGSGDYGVLVIDSTNTTLEMLDHQKREFEHMGVEMHGFILNKRKLPIPRMLFGLAR